MYTYNVGGLTPALPIIFAFCMSPSLSFVLQYLTSLFSSGSGSGSPVIDISVLRRHCILSSDRECVVCSRSQSSHISLCTSHLCHFYCDSTSAISIYDECTLIFLNTTTASMLHMYMYTDAVTRMHIYMYTSACQLYHYVLEPQNHHRSVLT